MLGKIQNIVIRNLMNVPGWRTRRKIVVFDSDDWGSIRMPSKEAYRTLMERGIQPDHSIYDKYDILEQRKDLEFLFEILSNYKDKMGNSPIFTFNTVMGNPDFEKIKNDNFEKYHYEDIEVSYQKYNGENIFDLWRQGMDEEFVNPQFHAREHLNVSLWMKALRNNHQETKTAFNFNFFGLKTTTPSPNQKNYLAAYWAESEHDFTHKVEILKEGLRRFRKKFSFPSETFVACNYIFPKEMEKSLLDMGIKYIQSQRGHLSPDIYSGDVNVRRHYTGKVNSYGQYYLVRNCSFEPTLDQKKDTVETCLKEIETSFRWKKPAIISTHRINYVGGMEEINRDRNLERLDKLLDQIVNRWPDVEFMSSAQLGKVIEGTV